MVGPSPFRHRPLWRFRTRPGLSPPKQTLLDFPAPSRAPLSGAPWGGTVAGFRGFGPGRPVRASFRDWAAGGLPCAARTWRVLGGFWRVVGAGPLERPRPGGATAFRKDGYCRALGFFRKGMANGCVDTSRARYVQHTNGPFSCAPPSPRRQIDRWCRRGRNSIFTLLFSLSLHTFPQNHLSAYLSAICRRLPTDKGSRSGHLSTFATNADRSPTHGRDVSTSRHSADMV